MHYITKKDSETGKKFQAIVDKRSKGLCEVERLSVKYGFEQWRGGGGSVLFGGISSCCDFKEKPDPKVWGKGAGRDEYMPKGNTKAGKAILAEFKELTHVFVSDLNGCVGSDATFSHIGFSFNCDDHFGFVTNKGTDGNVPADCEEVLESKYIEMFK